MRGTTRTLVVLSSLTLAACGAGAAAAATPTPASVLAQQYLRAANKANQAYQAVYDRIAQDCQTLESCKRDYAEFSQIDVTVASDVRAIKVPLSMQPDLRALLDILRRITAVDDDAAHAISFEQINSDVDAERALDAQRGDAVDHLRLDLGLPAAPRITPHPSAAASSSASA